MESGSLVDSGLLAKLASATAIARPRFGGVILADPAAIAGALLSFGCFFSFRHCSLQELISAHREGERSESLIDPNLEFRRKRRKLWENQ